MAKYNIGDQPCTNYTPQKSGPDLMDNVHECFGPFDGRPQGCTGTVSFCEACNRDHHSGGYGTCGQGYTVFIPSAHWEPLLAELRKELPQQAGIVIGILYKFAEVSA